MTKIISKFSIALFVIFLSSCSVLGTRPISAWQQYEQQMQQVQEWKIRGKLLFTDEQGKRESASLYWHNQELKKYFRIQLSGPVGIGRIQIEKNNQQILLKRGDQNYTFYDTTQALRYFKLPPLPVEQVSYWIKGISAPTTAPQQLKLGNERIQSFEQDGWIVTYEDYARLNGGRLPKRIRVYNPQHDVTVIIYHWELIHAG